MGIKIYPDDHNGGAVFDDGTTIETVFEDLEASIDGETITITCGTQNLCVRLTEDDILDKDGDPAGGTLNAAKTYLDDVFARTAQAKPTITSADNTSVASGDPVNFQVTCGLNDNVKLFSLSGQPDGIGIDIRGMIVGSSTSTGAHACTIYVTNSKGTTSQVFTLTIT